MGEEHFRLGTVEEGAQNAVGKALGLKPGERIVIVSDQYTDDIGKAIESSAVGIVGPGRVTRAYLEDFGDRGDAAALDPGSVMKSRDFRALLEDIEDSPAAVYMGRSMMGEVPIRGAIRKAGTCNGGRHLHLPNISEIIMCQGFCADQEAMQAYTGAMFEIAKKAKKAHVVSKNGTSAVVTFNGVYRWDKLGSILKAGEWGNVGAEIYACPESVDGMWHNDGGMGDVFTRYGLLTETPLMLRYENGRVVDATCDNEQLLKELYSAWNRHTNSKRAGEFGVPTNPEVSALGPIGINMQDEKAYVHVANGDPRPDRTGANWDCPGFHVDHTTTGATLEFEMGDGSRMRVIEDDMPTKEMYDSMNPQMAELMQYRLGEIGTTMGRELAKSAGQRNYLIRISQ